MSVLYFIIPVICIIFTAWLATHSVKKGFSRKKAVVLQICSVVAVMAAYLFVPMAHAADAAPAAAAISDAAYNAFGIGFIAMALSTGLAGIGGGIAVASAAPAAIAATSEDPKAFGKALIFVALGEGIAIYGLLISIMIFGKLSALGIGA